MKKRHLALWGLASFSLAAVTHAQAEPDGAALYQKNCAQCHGAELQGGNAQSMVDGVWQFGEGEGYVTRNIKHGITELGMPAYESTLNNDEIRAIVNFVLSAEKSSGAVKPPPPSEIQTQDYVVTVDEWVTGLDIPWGIAFPDAKTVLITERAGGLRVVDDGTLDPNPVAGTPEVLAQG